MVTLQKKVPTQKNQHWRTVIKGDEEIDTVALGPPTHTLDVNDKDAMRRAIEQVYFFFFLLDHLY